MTTTAIDEILSEVKRATVKFPTWPDDPLHALAIIGEEFGELTKEVLQAVYEPDRNSSCLIDIRKEAKQTAAMAIRFYMSLDEYRYRPAIQHKQL